ncbi:MAG: sulfate adenylyltransferase [Deltaproteobacteria bacterium]|nr:sulfate adenylyltransferase [Deltaproteobacteria bacterium]
MHPTHPPYDHSQDAMEPHGGVLVTRFADAKTHSEIESLARSGAPEIRLNVRELADLEMIATGALSPLTGFMGRADYERVVTAGRLASGLPWTIPVTLSARADVAARTKPGQSVLLRGPDNTLVGAMVIEDVFPYDKSREAQNVFGTQDLAHPAVGYLMNDMGDILLGGPIVMLDRTVPPFPAYHNEPRATRALFRELGWKRIVAFQTRNPIHRAHEFITKVALEISDGLLIHPLVGYTKEDDIPAETRMRCYELLLAGYYPKDRVRLSTLPAAMRYAGPKEAIFHAIMRKNYGCTHFIVGRDHAGVGNYYGTYDAQKIFDQYAPEDIGIVPLRFEHSFFCRKCGGMGTGKTCPHDKTHHVFLSGTKVRDMLRAGERPPEEFTRPEVADVLITAMRALAVA